MCSCVLNLHWIYAFVFCVCACGASQPEASGWVWSAVMCQFLFRAATILGHGVCVCVFFSFCMFGVVCRLFMAPVVSKCVCMEVFFLVLVFWSTCTVCCFGVCVCGCVTYSASAGWQQIHSVLSFIKVLTTHSIKCTKYHLWVSVSTCFVCVSNSVCMSHFDPTNTRQTFCWKRQDRYKDRVLL